jgi:multidrug efflux pump subunit AcrB
MMSRLGSSAFRAYSRSLDWVIARRGMMFAALVGIVVATAALYVHSPKGFLPKQDTGVFRANVVADSQVSAKEKARLIDIVVARIRQNKNVLRVLSFGTGLMFIELVPPDRRANSLEEISGSLRTAGTVAGATFHLSSIPELPLNAWVGHGDYQLALTDSSAAKLEKWAPILVDRLQKIPSLVDVSLDEDAYVYELNLHFDRDMAAKLDIRISDIDDALQDAFGERRVRAVHTDAGKVYVIMELDRSMTDGESVLQKVNVRSAQGVLVPISAFTSLSYERTPAAVQHKEQFPAASISFNLGPEVSIGTAVEVIRASLEQSGKPVTLQYSLEGTAGEFERSLASQPWLVLGAILVMYLILGILYESLVHPITILSSLPSAGLGALIFLRVADLDLSIIAVVGMLLLLGIAKKNAIMVVDFALRAVREGETTAVAVKQACLARLRPIMMTTFAALFGAFPLAFASGPGFELRRPLGISIVGGLLISQILTLYSTPVVYLVIDDLARMLRKRPQMRTSESEAAMR